MMSEGILSQTFALSLGRVLASLSTLITTSVLTHYLNIDHYAHYRMAMMMFNFIVPAMILGVPHALFVALAGEELDRQRQAIFQGFMLLSIMGLILAVLFLMFFDYVVGGSHDPDLLTLALPLAFLALSTMPKYAIPPPLITFGKVKILAIYQVVSQLMSSGLICFGAWLWMSAQATLWMSVLGASLSLIFAYPLLVRSMPGGLLTSLKLNHEFSVTLHGLKVLLSLGIPVGLARFFGTLSQQLDKYMVSQSFSTQEFAIYVTGAMEVPMITIITGALSSVLLPRLTILFKQGNHQEMGILWREVMEKTSLILLPMMWGVLCLGDELILCLFSETYREASIPFKIYALLLPLKCAVYGSVLIASERGRWVTLSALVGLIANVILNFILIRVLGINGPAWATVITAYLSTMVLFIPLCRLFKVKIRQLVPWWNLLKTGFISALPLILIIPLQIQLSAWSQWGRLLSLGTLYGVLTLALYLKCGMMKHLRELMSQRASMRR